MLTVTFKSPIVIDEKNLSSLLSLAGVAATVEPYLNGATKKPGRKPAVAAPAEPEKEFYEPLRGVSASTPNPEAVKPAGAKRGRKTNAQKEAEAAAAAAAAATSGGEPASTDSLLARFSGLIDTDFEGAKGILDKLGVERFSDLAESDYPAFDSALTELGA